jgi:hypothetical protein
MSRSSWIFGDDGPGVFGQTVATMAASVVVVVVV